MSNYDEIKQMLKVIQATQSEQHQLLVMVNTKLDILEQVNAMNPAPKAPKATRTKKVKEEETKNSDEIKTETRKVSPKRDIDEEDAAEDIISINGEVKQIVDDSDEKTTKTPKMPEPKAEHKSRALNKKEVFKLLFERDPQQFDTWLTAEIKAEVGKDASNEKDKRESYYKYMATKHDKDLIAIRNKYLEGK